MYYTYIIRSEKNGRFYIGSTENLERRLKEHENGNTPSLKKRGPFKLIYKEPHPTRAEARNRENQIKRFKSGNAFKKLLREKAAFIIE